MAYTTLLTSVENGICTITINRPDKLNALNKTVIEELSTAVDEVYNNALIKCAVITGAGPKAFVAGADIAEFLTLGAGGGEHWPNGDRKWYLIKLKIAPNRLWPR
jgi:enoyl-CoA hydratase